MAKRTVKAGKNVPRRKTAAGKTWLMALDPFGGPSATRFLSFAQALASQAGAKLDVVYVLAPAGLNWSGDFSGPWIKRYKPLAEEKLAEVTRDADIRGQVLTCNKSGQRAAVETLLRFAKKVKAECLLLATHSREGLERWALGSFAETAVLAAKIPLLIVNPQKSVPDSIKKILVPTDLGKVSDKEIARTADYAKRLGAEVVLYYKQPDPLDPIIQQGVYTLGGGWISVPTYVDAELQRKEKLMDRIEKALTAKGLKVSRMMDSSPGDLVESIERAAKECGADMVAVKTEADKWTATLLGSVARGLVRHATVPVMVQR